MISWVMISWGTLNWVFYKDSTMVKWMTYIFLKKYTSTNYNLYLRTFWKKLFYFFIQANHLQTTSVSPPNKTPPQCWGLDHRDPRERELILWISLERDDYLGSSTSSPLVGEGGRRESSSLVLETRGRRNSSSSFSLAREREDIWRYLSSPSPPSLWHRNLRY